MKMKRFLFASFVFTFSCALGMASAFACKMTPMASSSRAVAAILHQAESEASARDREIESIRRIKSNDSAWAYVVETSKQGRNCEASAYVASFQASCKVIVQKLATPYTCDNKRRS
jgi:hypothetical protein